MKTEQPILMYLLLTLSVGLKLTGQIDWHWAWVVAPLWLPIAAAFVVGIVTGTIAGFSEAFKDAKNKTT